MPTNSGRRSPPDSRFRSPISPGLVRIPSVSWDGFDHSHVEASAQEVKRLAEDTGVFDDIDIVQVPDRGGRPAGVAGGDRHACRPQRPADDPALRPPRRAAGGRGRFVELEPFEPTLLGDRLYGRGAADDKAGVMAHIAAIRALVAVAGEDLDVGPRALRRRRGGVRLPFAPRDPAALPRPPEFGCHRRRRLRQLGSRHPGSHDRPPRSRRVQPADHDPRPRIPLGDVRGSGARRPDGRDRTAEHLLEEGRQRRDRGAHEPRRRDSRVRRGEAARRDRASRRRRRRSGRATSCPASGISRPSR